MSRVIVTGGAGFIGSHTCVELIADGHEVLIIDNFVNSNKRSLDYLSEIVKTSIDFFEVDICDLVKTKKIFTQFKPEFVIHLAGLKSVDESVANPLKYYSNNVSGSINLLNAMESVRCENIVFSSSATVYGAPNQLPIDEKHQTTPLNPYGSSKLFIERIIADWQSSLPNRRAICLRYFNPIGAHPSGTLGERPIGVPKNIFPMVSGVAAGRHDHLKIYGNDYDTRDGTGERDYIHIIDLARAHSIAISALSECSFDVINIGTGESVTVRELVNCFQKVTGKQIKCIDYDRRPGDVAICFADVTKAQKILGWKADLSLHDACKDQWKWENFCLASKLG